LEKFSMANWLLELNAENQNSRKPSY